MQGHKILYLQYNGQFNALTNTDLKSEHLSSRFSPISFFLAREKNLN